MITKRPSSDKMAGIRKFWYYRFHNETDVPISMENCALKIIVRLLPRLFTVYRVDGLAILRTMYIDSKLLEHVSPTIDQRTNSEEGEDNKIGQEGYCYGFSGSTWLRMRNHHRLGSRNWLSHLHQNQWYYRDGA